MRAVLAVLAFALLAAAPSALGQVVVERGERVDIVSMRAPSVVLAERPFLIDVTVRNRMASEETVVVYVNLYDDRRPTDEPCSGGDAGERFRGQVSQVRRSVTLSPGATLEVKGALAGEADPWFQRIRLEQAPAAGAYQLCAWVERARQDAQRVFYDFEPAIVRVKLDNVAPTIAVAVEEPGGAHRDAHRFTATVSDADGDDVFVTWRFPDGSVPTGRVADHRFAAPGNYRVTANASDGFDATERAVMVSVRADGGSFLPTPVAATAESLAALAAVALALVTARRRRLP
ncbi:MAG TPA: PKD domain-containing protein [Candidatus Thermoplasmatota archaeon]|nr:PKD domain-containing protein [Candidatus Thermoplasmatota archaeon]